MNNLEEYYFGFYKIEQREKKVTDEKTIFATHANQTCGVGSRKKYFNNFI